MRSLKSYLLAMLFVLVAVPLVLFWAWPKSKALQSEVEQVRDRHLLVARNLSMALERYHADVTATFDFVAEGLLSGTDVHAARGLLQNLNFANICLIDLATKDVVGEVMASSGCAKDYLQAHAGRLEALSRQGITLVSGVERGPKGRPVLFVIRRSAERLAVGTLSTTYFVSLGKTISFGVKGHAAIVDQNGKVLAHPLENWIADMRDISKVSAVKRMLDGEQGVESFYSPALKDDMIAGFSAVPGTGWGVMVPQPMAELRVAARAVDNSSLAVFSIGLLLAAGMASLLAGMVGRPWRASPPLPARLPKTNIRASMRAAVPSVRNEGDDFRLQRYGRPRRIRL